MRNFETLKYINGIQFDSYGQRKDTGNEVEFQGILRQYQYNKVDDPRFADATYIVLTKEYLYEGETVIYGNMKYQVLYTIYSPRLNTSFLKEIKVG